jgi:hypothetical protein
VREAMDFKEVKGPLGFLNYFFQDFKLTKQGDQLILISAQHPYSFSMSGTCPA